MAKKDKKTTQTNVHHSNAKIVIVFLLVLIVVSLVLVGTMLNQGQKTSSITVSAYEKVYDSEGKPQSVFTTVSVVGNDKSLENVDEGELQRATTSLLRDENLDDLYSQEGVDAFNQKIEDTLKLPEGEDVTVMMTDFSVGALADYLYKKALDTNSSMATRSAYMDGLFGNLKGEKK